MRHEMHLRETPFHEIKSGKKTVEIRLYDEKRRKIKIGDEINFTLNEHEAVLTEVANLHRFSTFDDLFASPLRDKCGMPEISAEECKARMRVYYSNEQEARYGVLAIEIKLLDGAV